MSAEKSSRMSSQIDRLIEAWRDHVWNGPAVHAVERQLTRRSEAAVLAAVLAVFAACLFAYSLIAHATVDVHFDVAELSVWAQELSLGYKHPPLSAWVFALWTLIFPVTDWSAYLLAVVNVTVTLAITWRLLRDYLDRDRALVGLAALMLVPLYLFPAMRFNANTVMMPFWAAALLFFLRAMRAPRAVDAVLAGVFAGLTFLGKYWGIYLVVGMLLAALLTTDIPHLLRTRAPYLMALVAALVVTPHLVWMLSHGGFGAADNMTGAVMVDEGLAARIARSSIYLGGLIGYMLAPLAFLAVLRPGGVALGDTLWPADHDRRRALLVFLLPLLLPALANLALPHRLTTIWTFPNWALLPLVLFGSPYLTVRPVAAARAVIVTAMVLLAGVLVSPYLAYKRLWPQKYAQEAYYRLVARDVRRLAGGPVRLIYGSYEITQGLPFYLPEAHKVSSSQAPLLPSPGPSPQGFAVVCEAGDAACRQATAALTQPGIRAETVTYARKFLGASGPSATFVITIVPPAP